MTVQSERITSYPVGHWGLQVGIPYSMGVACDEMIFLCGQADLQGQGDVLNPGDLLTQSRNSIQHIENIFNDLGADFDNLTKLVVFYVPDPEIDTRLFLDTLAACIDSSHRPVISLVPVPRMFYPGLSVEIDAYGVRGENISRLEVPDLSSGFSAVVRAGRMVFGGAISSWSAAGGVLESGDVVAQSQLILETLQSRLSTVGASVDDLVKINNWYVAGGSADQWAESARVRAAFYPEPGPCATGIPMVCLNHPGEMIQTDFWAMLHSDGSPMPKTHCWPENHWDWPIHLPFKHGLKCGNLVFTGGQVSMDSDANVLNPGKMEVQTRISMDNLGKVLQEFGLDHRHIVKLNTYYQGSNGEDESSDGNDLHSNVQIRGGYFKSPGPASTGIPFRCLAYDGMLIEIEAIAML